MARKTRRSDGAAPAPERKRRLTAPVAEALYRKTGAFAKAHGLKLGDVVSDALEAHMRHWYTVDRRADAGRDAPAKGADGAAGPALAEGTEAA